MRKLVLATTLGLSGLFTLPAHALTASGAFDVTVNLYPKCELTVASPTLTLNYVSFQTSDSVNTMGASVKCTNTLPYTLSVLNGGGAAAASGTLAGLNYTLSVPAPGPGTGAAQAFNVTGTIAAGQGGTCATANTATTGAQTASVTGASTGAGTACTATSAANAHVLTVTY
jgi:hypothetical protein